MNKSATDDGLPHDASLSASYRSLPDPAPNTTLDAAILLAAAQAVQRPVSRIARLQAWFAPCWQPRYVGTFASVGVVCLAALLMLNRPTAELAAPLPEVISKGSDQMAGSASVELKPLPQPILPEIKPRTPLDSLAVAKAASRDVKQSAKQNDSERLTAAGSPQDAKEALAAPALAKTQTESLRLAPAIPAAPAVADRSAEAAAPAVSAPAVMQAAPPQPALARSKARQESDMQTSAPAEPTADEVKKFTDAINVLLKDDKQTAAQQLWQRWHEQYPDYNLPEGIKQKLQRPESR
jgi:hypothetical protein